MNTMPTKAQAIRHLKNLKSEITRNLELARQHEELIEHAQREAQTAAKSNEPLEVQRRLAECLEFWMKATLINTSNAIQDLTLKLNEVEAELVRLDSPLVSPTFIPSLPPHGGR